jgi:hypothetical protein
MPRRAALHAQEHALRHIIGARSFDHLSYLPFLALPFK